MINNKKECIALVSALPDDLSLFNSDERKDLFEARTYFIGNFSQFDEHEKKDMLSKKSFVKNLTPRMSEELLEHCLQEKFIPPVTLDSWFSSQFRNDTLLSRYIDLLCQNTGNQKMIDTFLDKRPDLFIAAYNPENPLDTMEILARKMIDKIHQRDHPGHLEDNLKSHDINPTEQYKKSLYADDIISFIHQSGDIKYFTDTQNIFLQHFERMDSALFLHIKNASAKGIKPQEHTDISFIQHVFTQKSGDNAKEMFYLYHKDILKPIEKKSISDAISDAISQGMPQVIPEPQSDDITLTVKNATPDTTSISSKKQCFTGYLLKNRQISSISFMDLSLLDMADSVIYLMSQVQSLRKYPRMGITLTPVHHLPNQGDMPAFDGDEMKIMHSVDSEVLHQLAYNEPIRQEAKDYISKILLARKLEDKLDKYGASDNKKPSMKI